MSNKPRLRYHSVTIAAGSVDIKDVVGEFMYVSLVTDDVYISLDDETPVLADGAMEIRLQDGDQFKKITLYNQGAGSITVGFYVGFGSIKKDSLTISGTVTVAENPLSTLTDAADVSITAVSTVQVVAANGSRKLLIVTNPISNTQVMRVGSASAGAARGFILPPGGVFEEKYTGALYAYNPGGSAESLTVTEIT